MSIYPNHPRPLLQHFHKASPPRTPTQLPTSNNHNRTTSESSSTNPNHAMAPPTCYISGCHFQPHTNQLGANYCDVHRCTMPDCSENRTSTTLSYLCQNHQCLEMGCTNLIFTNTAHLIGHRNELYCHQHYCHTSNTTRCSQSRRLSIGSLSCMVHECRLQGCRQHCDSSQSRDLFQNYYCRGHTCGWPNFLSQVTVTPWCVRHQEPEDRRVGSGSMWG